MLKLAIVVAIVCLQLSWAQQQVSYEGYKVYHVTPKSIHEAEILHALENNLKYDFWLEPRALNTTATLMVSPDEQTNFEKLMKSHNINATVLIHNVQTTIPKLRTTPLRIGEVTFTDYMTHSEINAYLNRLALEYPNIVTLQEFGNSYEGRQLEGVKISTGGINKPAIFIDAGIHAREWIAPATALYIIHQLVENASNYPLYEEVDWIILPVLNPDGYEYSRHVEPMWRKTRRPTTNASCPGIDGNRNFDYYWMTIGASADPCSQTYAGPQPNSEPETVALENYLQTHKDTIKLYLTLHSYGRYLLYPWGYTSTLPSNEEELYNLGYAVAIAIASVNDTAYIIGSSSNVLYPTSGSSQDYAAGPAGIPLSYTVELPEGGAAGFHPPPERILPIARETVWGLKEFWVYVVERFVT